MKFIVSRDYNNVVDVELHWETKEKIQRIATYVAGAALTAATIVVVLKTRTNDAPNEA